MARRKLTHDLVHYARREAAAGKSIAFMARMHGVGYHTLLSAVRGRTWTHMDTPPVPANPTQEVTEYQQDRRILTPDQVRDARTWARRGSRIKDIADHYGVSYSTARSAIVGKTWADITDVAPVVYNR